jgi:hypothetical protein
LINKYPELFLSKEELDEIEWNNKYEKLKIYIEKENKLLGRKHPDLGLWVNTQKTLYKNL